jgi:hypothetical protein
MSDSNGEKPHRPVSPLEVVEKRIAARHASEEEALQIVEPDASTAHDTEPPVTEDDPLTAWKRRVPGKPITLEQIHAGLIATCEYSEAAIEGGIRMAADVHEVVQTVDQRTQQIAILTARAESTSAFVHRIDQELADKNVTLEAMRRDVQFLAGDERAHGPDRRPQRAAP